MKKIVLLLSFLFAFSMNAQDKKLKPADAAKADALELKALVKLNETETYDMTNLFQMKYEMLAIEDISQERKNIMKQTLEAKIRASLTPDQMATLESKPELLKRLIE
ncbi:MAG: hypothetical protein ACI9XR_001988 [Flavobacterium sp.]|jgi:hypothetical protein